MYRKTNFLNRDVSWLAFNARVMQEAEDFSVPIINRIRFLGIVSSNLDEFFQIRVPSVTRLTSLKNAELLYGFNPKKILSKITREGEQQVRWQDTLVIKQLIPELASNNIFILNETQLSVEQNRFIQSYFETNLLPLIIPIMLEDTQTIPRFEDGISYLLVEMGNKENYKPRRALVEIPTDSHPRFVDLPQQGDKINLMFLDDVIRVCLPRIFSIFDYDKFEAFAIKVTRDAEIDMDSDFSSSLVERLSKGLKDRGKGRVMRIVHDRAMSPSLLSFLTRRFGETSISKVKGGRYHNLKDLVGIPNVGNLDLYNQEYSPLLHPDLDLKSSTFSIIEKKNVLLSYPYQTFDSFVHFLREAAIDPTVESIDITLYRLAKDSRVIRSLISAAKNGKKVFAYIELRARFDEARNIKLAGQLAEAGIHVYSGFENLKVHAKTCLITRLVKGHKKYLAYLGTGNLNERTATLYADYGILTASNPITKDLVKFFSELKRGLIPSIAKVLWISPHGMRRKMNAIIDREINFAKKGLLAYLIFKVNSLTDTRMITKLYEASKAGVKIKLIVRGACCLKAGVRGLSANIEVISIVDEFLEHARVFIWGNGGREQIYLSSADLMLRNLDYRIEVAFPILDASSKKIIRDMINLQLTDTTKARLIDKSLLNEYKEQIVGIEPVWSQKQSKEYFRDQLIKIRNKNN